jgi:hypothetical protein
MRKAVAILITSCLILAACSKKDEEQAAATVSVYAKMGRVATNEFAQMSLSFQGNPPEQEIQDKVDKALGLFGLDANESNRNMAGRTLVALRKETGNSEMAILARMLSTPGSGGKFEDAAARTAEEMNR